jgi:hypothetical protein
MSKIGTAGRDRRGGLDRRGGRHRRGGLDRRGGRDRREGRGAWEDAGVTSAVVDEAIKKAAVAWVAVAGRPARALWCLPLEGSLLVVSGPGEQSAPDLADAERAQVRLRGDNGGLIVVCDVAVRRVLPGSEDWETVAPQLAGKRLNAPGSADDLVARWVTDGCAIVRLTPVPDAAAARPELPDDAQAATPRETPARVPVRRPFRLHRVRRPRR